MWLHDNTLIGWWHHKNTHAASKYVYPCYIVGKKTVCKMYLDDLLFQDPEIHIHIHCTIPWGNREGFVNDSDWHECSVSKFHSYYTYIEHTFKKSQVSVKWKVLIYNLCLHIYFWMAFLGYVLSQTQKGFDETPASGSVE